MGLQLRQQPEYGMDWKYVAEAEPVHPPIRFGILVLRRPDAGNNDGVAAQPACRLIRSNDGNAVDFSAPEARVILDETGDGAA